MKLRILGCSGGIGGALRTTSMLLDHDVLIDAGTGVGDLQHRGTGADRPCVPHALASRSRRLDPVSGRHRRLDARQAADRSRDRADAWKSCASIFSTGSCGRISRRFRTPQNPFLRYETIARWRDRVRLTAAGSRRCRPTTWCRRSAFALDSGRASLVFTGDTTTNDALWHEVNQIDNLRYLIIETAFCNREKDLAVASKHLCPSLLAEELANSSARPRFTLRI